MGEKDKDVYSTLIGWFIVVCIMVGGFAFVNYQREAGQEDGRRILCTGIVANANNLARDDPEVIRLCKEVGVDRADYAPTVRIGDQ